MLKVFEKLIQLDLVTPIREIASLFDRPDEAGGLKHRVWHGRDERAIAEMCVCVRVCVHAAQRRAWNQRVHVCVDVCLGPARSTDVGPG